MSDKYDRAIKYLTKHPKRIVEAWSEWARHAPNSTARFTAFKLAHCLFERAGEGSCGCLTQIKGNPSFYKAQTPKLTRAIVRDKRIPSEPEKVKVKHLPVFAEWQRRIDKELGRKP